MNHGEKNESKMSQMKYFYCFFEWGQRYPKFLLVNKKKSENGTYEQ